MEMMIDLETLDTGPRSLVLTAGVVLFNDKGEFLSRTLLPSFTEQQRRGRTMSLETLRFWIKTAGEDWEAALESFALEAERQSLDHFEVELRRLVETRVAHPYEHRFDRATPPGVSVLDAMRTGQSLFPEQIEEVEAVWANGDLFDLGVLQDLFGGKLPWAYNAPRDLRTLTKEAAPLGWQWPERAMNLPKHDAVADCRYQIEVLRDVRQFLRGFAR